MLGPYFTYIARAVVIICCLTFSRAALLLRPCRARTFWTLKLNEGWSAHVRSAAFL